MRKSEDNLMPPKTISASKLKWAAVYNNLSKDSTLLENLYMNIEALVFVHAKDSEERPAATKAPEVVPRSTTLGRQQPDPSRTQVHWKRRS
jgi:hypothetical protein